ncbi:MAG: carboxylesterase family protein [Clostridia bacterium]|nr:carboxylesterase family protein [Clostridia bacterium]
MTQFLCTRKEPIVTVKQGKLRGYFFDGVYRFLGVPYAKAKRFEMPEEPDCWEGVRNALAYGKICPILHDPGFRILPVHKAFKIRTTRFVACLYGIQ